MAKSPKTKSEPAEGEGDDWITRSIRFPPALYERLGRDARKERRSTQLHVIWMIEEAYRILDQQGSANE